MPRKSSMRWKAPSVHPERDTKRKADSFDGGSSCKVAKSYSYGEVARVQQIWIRKFRHWRTYILVDNYFATGPTIEHVKSISFEALTAYLMEKPIIAVTKACLQRIHLLSTFRHGSPSTAIAPENVNVRVFLAAFMIAYRPTHVFESMGALEQSLFESAIPLITTFEGIIRCIHTSSRQCFQEVPHELSGGFPMMLSEYLKRFKAWKIPDEAKLTCRIKHALIALYQAEEYLPPNEPEDSKTRVEIRAQIERLRGKMQQIAGVDALNKFDEQRKVGLVSGPRTGVSGSSGSAYAALPGRMTNEQLAHELLLNPTFQLDESGGCGVENPVFHRIRESFHRAFWDSLEDDLKLDSPCYVRVLRVLSEIREGIADLSGSRESKIIREAVDLEFIKQQAEQGLYEWGSCMRLIGSIVAVIQRVQTPKRDLETRTRWKQVGLAMQNANGEDRPRAFCKALEFLLDRVNVMRIDAANARLRLIAPVIKDHGIDYERGKFQDRLDKGTLTLDRTQEWIRKTMIREINAKTVELQNLVEGKTSSYVHIHTVAMMSLVADTAPLNVENSNYPETLQFDVQRLSILQREFKYLVTSATMLVNATHGVNSTKNFADTKVLTSISELFVSDSKYEIDVDQTVADIGKIMERTSLSEESRSKLLRALAQCATPSDAVHKLLEQRIRMFWIQIMKEGKVPLDLQIISFARVLIPRIEKAAKQLMALANMNRTVHLPTYNKLIGKAAHQIADDGTAT